MPQRRHSSTGPHSTELTRKCQWCLRMMWQRINFVVALGIVGAHFRLVLITAGKLGLVRR